MNFFKKTVMMSALLITSSAFAQHCAVTPAQQKGALFEGVTVSGALGWVTGGVKSTQMFYTVNAPNTLSSAQLNSSGALGEISVGYGELLGDQPFYLGGEAYVTMSSLKGSHAFNSPVIVNATLRTKTSFGVGVRFKPGVVVNQTTLAYGIAGLGMTRWKMDLSQDSGNLRFSSAASNKMLMGFSFGAGLMTQVGCGLSAGIEFIRTVYYKAPTLIQKSGANPGFTLNHSFKPATNVVQVKLNYHF